MVYEEILKIVTAVFVGLIIGFERERNHKPVGIRSFATVCVATTFITMLSQEYFPEHSSRVIQGVITGIGFLGAGAVMVESHAVKGITTAAMTWAIAIIGIGIGLGEFVLAIIVSVVMLSILMLGRETKHINDFKIRVPRLKNKKK